MSISLVQLSLKEWQRRPLRTAISTAGVAIAIATLFSLLAFERGYREGLRKELDRFGAHVLVVPKGCPYDAASIALHGANWPCYLKERYLEEVRFTPGVATAAPVFMAAVYDSDGTQAVYLGVETNIVALKPGWRISGQLPEREGDVLLGAETARRRGWRIGQSVDLPGLTNEVGKVTGILSPTQGADDTFIYLGLVHAQRLFKHPQELTHILVRLADPNQLDSTVQRLRGCDAGLAMNVVPLAHLFHTIQALVNSTRVFLSSVALVALLAAGAGISNTILMSVAERTREIGVMRALGASRAGIFQLIWVETIQVCLAAAVLGIALAIAASRIVESWVRSKLPFAPTDPLIHWEWSIGAACLVFAVGLGSLAALLPAARAARIQPMIAMRGGASRR